VKKPQKDYTVLKELLEDTESFPTRYLYKFIGRNTEAFVSGVKTLEKDHPALQHQTTRESANAQHLAKTYAFEAPDAESIIAIYRHIEGLADLLLLL